MGGHRLSAGGLRCFVSRVKNGSAPSLTLSTYEALQRLLTDHTGAGRVVTASIAGAIAGPLGWIACYPIEVYRIHTQASSKRSAGFRADITRISESGGGGVRAWFRGCASCCLRSALQIPTTMLVFESLQAKTRETAGQK